MPWQGMEQDRAKLGGQEVQGAVGPKAAMKKLNEDRFQGWLRAARQWFEDHRRSAPGWKDSLEQQFKDLWKEDKHLKEASWRKLQKDEMFKEEIV